MPALPSDRTPLRFGEGLAILVNANAKRGGRRVAAQIARALPRASVRLTRTLEEAENWLATLPSPECVLAAGGDGTAVALLNALDRVTPADRALPKVGVLPLGTGNAWAHSTGAPKLGIALRLLETVALPLCTRRFGLVSCDGMLTHFAGSGWDAQIINDYRAQLSSARGPTRHLSKTVYGYFSAMLLRTAPKAMLFGRPRVLIENLGDEVFRVAENGRLEPVRGVRPGTILYDGPVSVGAVSTCPEFGYGLRAFPFAELCPGYLNLRVYDQPTLSAILSIPKLWLGAHPIEGMHDWFVTNVRMTFSRPTPLQIGGDALGERQTVEYRLAERRAVDVLDWSSMT